MTVINMTETCKKQGITTFSRTRGGWMKQVDGLDKSQSNGYSFVGSNFIKVGNFKTNIMNGLYLDQSTSIVDDKKVLTMNLFKIVDGEVELLKTTPKTRGWAVELWDEVEKYFESEEITAQEIVNKIREITNNKAILEEVAEILTFDPKDESMYKFRNWFETKSYLTKMECYPIPLKFICGILEDKDSRFYPQYFPQSTNIRGDILKLITTHLNFIDEEGITENTFVDVKKINPENIKRISFQTMIELYDVHYIVTTLGNATGYHNIIAVYMYFIDDGVLTIRHFSYYCDPRKLGHIPEEVYNRWEFNL